MKHTTTLLLALALTASAFAANGRFSGGSPATVNNDDTCDISVLPAATLLLPYFEVDIDHPDASAQTTIFTVTNVSRFPQIARVTLWTDYAWPILNFNLFLTGYDVQAINLRDILVRGVIAPPNGTSTRTASGPLSERNGANPNFALNAVNDCELLPGVIPSSLMNDIRSALQTGVARSCPGARVGSVHPHATGYATIDVVSTCGIRFPLDAGYYTNELLYDNVLMGDYEQINPDTASGNYAGGNPLVHIRAIPEGGAAGSLPGTNLPYTFYDRFTPRDAHTRDRRQPLPSAFAARYIQGGVSAFNTSFKIWREGMTGSAAACADYAGTLTKLSNGAMPVTEIVRFDEHENFMTFAPIVHVEGSPGAITLPSASSLSTSGGTFPPLATSGDVAGWMYLNLNNGGAPAYGVAGGRDTTRYQQTGGPRQSQNWVVVSMAAEGRYSVDYDALALGNGCSPAPASSTANSGVVPIGPLPDANP
jgi:hypothetical protein